MKSTGKRVSLCLLAVVVSLLLVGLVSGTPLRHVIQVAPGAILLLLLFTPLAWTSDAALAIFGFWLVIMTLIWLWLLGIARIVTGTFTPVEIALTIVIGGASAVGLVAAARARPRSAWRVRLGAFLAAALLQVGTVWLSVQPSFATR
jgi:hypothetical protein